MSRKHIFLIHGRATKPRREEKERLAKLALLHGLNRADPAAARAVESGDVKLSFIYYGDICNDILINKDPDLKKSMILNNNTWYEKDNSYDESLNELFKNTKFEKDGYLKICDNKNFVSRYTDDLARVFSVILSGGLSRRLILKYLPDLGGYITSRKIGSKIRERLQKPLGDALSNGEEVVIVSHSMGCIATYDVLWKFSHMSEYSDLHDKRVSLWLTLGSPLGEPSVRECLYDSNEPADGRYPRNIETWINISAHDDFVAHDYTAEDDFREMELYGTKIIDLPRIYTFWKGRSGANPHKFYGYLDHPRFAEQLACWIKKDENIFKGKVIGRAVPEGNPVNKATKEN